MIAISGLALRLSSNPSPNSGRNSSDSRCATDLERRFLPRPPVASVRAQHPYGAMLYSEFEYRPPPPTYAASMQQHRLRLAAFRRGLSGRRSCTWSSLLNGLSGFSGLNGLSPFNVASNRIGNGTSSGSGPPIESLQNPVHMNVASPPPTYRNSPTSSPAESLRRPPSYRTAVRDHKQLPPSLLSSHNNQDDNGDNINSIESTPGEHPSIDESPNIMTSNQRPIASELQILAHL